MGDYARPLPVPDTISAPYWEGARRHELRIQRCAGCGVFRFPPSPICPRCRSPEAGWVRASGRGKVYSWIVVVHPVPREMFETEVPYVVALVELEEGVRLPTNLVECDPGSVEPDMAVEVVFDDVSPEVTLPKFRPRRPAAG